MWQNYVGHDATGSRVESRHLICSTVYQLLLASHASMSSYIRNKMAKLVVCVARQDWPHNYQDFFTNIYIVREFMLLDCVIIIVCQHGRAMQSTCENIHHWALGVTVDVHIYTVSQKMSHLCFAITLTYVNILICFGRNVTHKVSNQKYFTIPPQVTYASALPGKTGNTKIAFFHWNGVSVHCQNSTSRSLISSVFLTHDSYSRCCMTP